MDKKYINPMISSMAGRLGIYNGTPKIDDPRLNIQDSVNTAIDGVHQQSSLLNLYGGHAQQERMIQDKKRSLDRALRYSYQGADIQRIDSEDDSSYRVLINPNKLKPDYDDKIVSCHWEYDLTPGTVFKWLGTNTYWLVYLQNLTELAYFRGDIRKCSHTIKWFDEDTKEIKTAWAAVRGPAQTNIQEGSLIDMPNYSLSILIPSSESALKYLRRYDKFYLQGLPQGSPSICWRINAVNWVSMPGVIELIAEEYYSNKDTDIVDEIPGYKELMEKEELENSLQEEEQQQDIQIVGDNFIKPKVTYTFSCSIPGDWHIKGGNNYPLEVISKTPTEIAIKWQKYYSGQFILEHVTTTGVTLEKTIVVETLY